MTPKLEALIRLTNVLGIAFLLEIRPASRQPGWAAPEAHHADVVEDVQLEQGDRDRA